MVSLVLQVNAESLLATLKAAPVAGKTVCRKSVSGLEMVPLVLPTKAESLASTLKAATVAGRTGSRRDSASRFWLEMVPLVLPVTGDDLYADNAVLILPPPGDRGRPGTFS